MGDSPTVVDVLACAVSTATQLNTTNAATMIRFISDPLYTKV
jgi:hypothetical protein